MRLALAALLVTGLAGIAAADPASDAKAKALANEGSARFAANDFTGAAAKFDAAYQANRDPSYLFNAAQAYRHGGDCIRAADYYGRFLGEVPHPPNEDKIRVWYASQLTCAKERAAASTVEPAPHSEPPPAHSEPPPPEPLPAEPSPPPPPPGAHRHTGVVIALATTSAVAFGVGGFFAWDSGYLSDQRKAALDRCSIDDRCSSALINDYDRRGARANALALAGFIIGGLTLATSATVYVISRPDRPTPYAVAPIDHGAMVTRAFAW